jgi:hypothetical protein
VGGSGARVATGSRPKCPSAGLQLVFLNRLLTSFQSSTSVGLPGRRNLVPIGIPSGSSAIVRNGMELRLLAKHRVRIAAARACGRLSSYCRTRTHYCKNTTSQCCSTSQSVTEHAPTRLIPSFPAHTEDLLHPPPEATDPTTMAIPPRLGGMQGRAAPRRRQCSRRAVPRRCGTAGVLAQLDAGLAPAPAGEGERGAGGRNRSCRARGGAHGEPMQPVSRRRRCATGGAGHLLDLRSRRQRDGGRAERTRLALARMCGRFASPRLAARSPHRCSYCSAESRFNQAAVREPVDLVASRLAPSPRIRPAGLWVGSPASSPWIPVARAGRHQGGVGLLGPWGKQDRSGGVGWVGAWDADARISRGRAAAGVVAPPPWPEPSWTPRAREGGRQRSRGWGQRRS